METPMTPWWYTSTGELKAYYNKLDIPQAWGAYIWRPDNEIKFMLQVPHPVADTNTQFIGARMFYKMPNAFLMMAGAHRQAGGNGGNQGLADVPWNPGSMFNKVCAHMQPLPALQVHGYANARQPNFEIVIATGSAPLNNLAIETHEVLHNAGFNIARYWEGESDVLGAAGNEQSKLARDNGVPFVHLEMNHSLRTNNTRMEQLIDLVAPVFNSI